MSELLIGKLKKRITNLKKENNRLRIELNHMGWVDSGKFCDTKQKVKERAIKAVCEYYQFDLKQIAGKGRKRELVSARFILCHLLYREAFMSLNTIGAVLGGRDHTTILHAIREVDNRIVEVHGYPEYQDYYNIKKTLYEKSQRTHQHESYLQHQQLSEISAN